MRKILLEYRGGNLQMYHCRFKGSHYDCGFHWGSLLQKNNVMPYGIDKSSSAIDRNCNKTGSGDYCFAKIIKDGWKITDDYPW